MKQITVFFEGWGLPMFSFNRVAFTLFGKVDVYWSWLVILLGVAVGLVLAVRRGKKQERIAGFDLLEIALCALLGSRILPLVAQYGWLKSFRYAQALELWGSIVLAALFALIACRLMKLRWQKAADALAPAFLLCLAVWMWATFADGSGSGAGILSDRATLRLFGQAVTLPAGEGSLLWFFRMGLYPNAIVPGYLVFVHPLFLYLSVWCLAGAVWISLIYRHKFYDGQVFLLAAVWLSLGVVFPAGLSEHALAPQVQWVAGILAILGIFCLIERGIAYGRAKKRLDAGLLVRIREEETE